MTASTANLASTSVRRARRDAKALVRSAPTFREARERCVRIVECPGPDLDGMRICDLLWATRGVSVMTAWRLLVKAGIARESKPLGELTMRQRHALMSALRGEDA